MSEDEFERTIHEVLADTGESLDEDDLARMTALVSSPHVHTLIASMVTKFPALQFIERTLGSDPEHADLRALQTALGGSFTYGFLAGRLFAQRGYVLPQQEPADG